MSEDEDGGSARDHTGKDRPVGSRGNQRAQARWEAGAQRNWDLQEGADGSIESVLGGLEEANKRKRLLKDCLLYTSPSPRDGLLSRMPSSA